MKRSSVALTLILLLVLVVGGCSDGGTEEQTGGPDPVSTVETWLAAVSELDTETIAEVTSPQDVALMAAAENAFTSDQLVAVADSGLPGPTASSYWSSFRDGIVTFLGADPDTLVVGEAEAFEYAGTEWSVVTVGTGESNTGVVTRLTDDGWVVDMVATTGPALAVQLRRLLEDLGEQADEDVTASYATIAAESLGAALDRDPDNRALELEVEAIEDLHLDG